MENKPALVKTIDPQKQRIVWVDFARVLSAFLVVLAHVEGWGSSQHWARIGYYTVSRAGVPIFMLLSGFLLLSHHDEDMTTFFKKRAGKIVIPLFFWSFAYDIYLNHELAKTGLTLPAVWNLFLRVFKGPRFGHLWFFYVLVGLYFFTPILRLFVAKARRKDILFYIAIWFAMVPGLSILTSFTSFRFGFEFQFATGYIGYYLLGLLFGQMEITRGRVIWSLVVFIVFSIFTFFIVYWDLWPKMQESTFRSYLSFNIIFMALPAFILMRAVGEKIKPSRILTLVSQASFGIYLMHLLFFHWMGELWQRLGFDMQAGGQFWMIPIVTVVIFIISFGVTLVIRKIPILKTVAP